MTFEKRVIAALTNRDITSDTLAGLITETEAAITQAERAAEAERKRALDPTLSPDAAKARQAMENAAFTCDRLRNMLPRLRTKYQHVAGAEEYTAWAATFDAVKPKHAAAAAKLRAVCTEFEAKLVEALTEAKQVDAEVRRVSSTKPYRLPQSNNDGRSLPTVECEARGLPGIYAEFSLMQLKLPAFDKANQLAWPPYETPLALQVVGGMVPVAGDPRLYSGDWWRVGQEQAAAARAKAQREQEQRQAEIDANYHGPRWWERTAS
jgi:hypothetical protein